jgi:hypothetical protein
LKTRAEVEKKSALALVSETTVAGLNKESMVGN